MWFLQIFSTPRCSIPCMRCFLRATKLKLSCFSSWPFCCCPLASDPSGSFYSFLHICHIICPSRDRHLSCPTKGVSFHCLVCSAFLFWNMEFININSIKWWQAFSTREEVMSFHSFSVSLKPPGQTRKIWSRITCTPSKFRNGGYTNVGCMPFGDMPICGWWHVGCQVLQCSLSGKSTPDWLVRRSESLKAGSWAFHKQFNPLSPREG